MPFPTQHVRWLRPLRAVLVAGLLIPALPGCEADEPLPRPGSTTYVDDLDRRVDVQGEIGRVISVAPSMTEIIYAAGGGGKLVGVTTADDYPPSVDTLSRFAALPLDFEAIAALKPDLVLATDQINSVRDAESLQAIGIPTVFFSFDELKDVPAAIRETGALLGTAAHARAAADSLQAGFDSLRAVSDTLAERPSVLVLAGSETLYSFGQESFVHELVALAGGRSVMEDLAATAPILSEEYVLKADPDYLIGIWGPGYDGRRLLELHPAFRQLSAVKNGRVYSLDGDLISLPTPRLLDGARQLAAILHPRAPGDEAECGLSAPAPCL